ncbi:MAG: hypothetical protein US49_C0001G0026 [candidate division TM6 bacterium GW2011_GWF2_37_49]|nr:MAG: hypothetical protein US49_C0001G0026 [candidate division TM6 bacterium GW2011_GWF2_37_49]
MKNFKRLMTICAFAAIIFTSVNLCAMEQDQVSAIDFSELSKFMDDIRTSHERHDASIKLLAEIEAKAYELHIDNAKGILFNNLTAQVNQFLSSMAKFDYTLFLDAAKTNDNAKLGQAMANLMATIMSPILGDISSSLAQTVCFMVIIKNDNGFPHKWTLALSSAFNEMPALMGQMSTQRFDKNKSDAENIDNLKNTLFLFLEALFKKVVENAQQVLYPTK